MVEIGYTLSSEEHGPRELVRYGKLAEEAGFSFLTVSDHFHPWTDRQGNSSFVWSVLGGLAEATDRIRVGTGVTCPILRIHPVLVAQAAATVGCMMPGRSFLTVGSGENLNEHVTGDRWPGPSERLDMLEEAIELIRLLWGGETVTRRTSHYTVDRARIYSLPDELPPIVVAASGPRAVNLAGSAGDGLMTTSPAGDLVDGFRRAGGLGKPIYGKVTVCYGTDDAEARREALEWWPNTSLPGDLSVELPMPRDFEDASELLTEGDVEERVLCGRDVDRVVEQVGTYVEAGFDHVFLHQVGPRQEEFLGFAKETVLPTLEEELALQAS